MTDTISSKVPPVLLNLSVTKLFTAPINLFHLDS